MVNRTPQTCLFVQAGSNSLQVKNKDNLKCSETNKQSNGQSTNDIK